MLHLKKLSALDVYLSNNDFHSEISILNKILKEAGAVDLAIVMYPELESGIKYLFENGVKPAHLKHIAKWVKENPADPAEDILPYILSFYNLGRNLEKKDLLQYSNAAELRTVINQYEDERERKRNKRKKFHITEEEMKHIEGTTTRVYPPGSSMSKYFVYYPHSVVSSCYYGQETNWCTTGKISYNQFDNYAGKDVHLYYIVTRGVSSSADPMAKISIGLVNLEDGVKLAGGSSTVNAVNKSLTIDEIQEYLGGEGEEILSAIWSDAASRKMTSYNEIVSKTTLDEYNDQIDAMGESQASVIRRQLAGNKNTNIDILRQISKSNDDSARANLADNIMKNNSSKKDADLDRLLLDLINTSNEAVNKKVAESSNISLEISKLLLSKEEPLHSPSRSSSTSLSGESNRSLVLEGLSSNGNIPDDYDFIKSLYGKLSGPLKAATESYNEEDDGENLLDLDLEEEPDTNSVKALNVLYSARLRTNLLKKLTRVSRRDSDNYHKYLELFLNDDDLLVKKELAGEAKYSKNVLVTLAEDDDEIVRSKISSLSRYDASIGNARDDELDEYYIDKFYNDESSMVVSGVLKRRELDEKQIEAAWNKFFDDENFGRVQFFVAQNINTPDDIIRTIAKDDWEHDDKSEAKHKLAAKQALFSYGSKLGLGRAWTEFHDEIANILIQHKDPNVRKSIVNNKNIPIGMFERLAGDWDPIVLKSVVNHKQFYDASDEVRSIQRSIYSPLASEEVRVEVANSKRLLNNSDLMDRISEDKSAKVIRRLLNTIIRYKETLFSKLSYRSANKILNFILNNSDYFKNISRRKEMVDLLEDKIEEGLAQDSDGLEYE